MVVGRANAQDPQGWKRPWGLWGWGLGSTEQKGPRHAPHPWSQRVGDLIWEPSRLPGLEWVGQTPSSPLQLVQDGSSHLSLLISPASLLRPQDQCGQGERGASEGRGPAWELSKLPGPEWAGQMPSAPLPLLPEGPSHLSLLISLTSGAPILFGLHFSSPLSPPTSYQFSWGFLLSPWASGCPTSSRQAP